MIRRLGKTFRKARKEDEIPAEKSEAAALEAKQKTLKKSKRDTYTGEVPRALDIAKSQHDKKVRDVERRKEKGLPAFAEFGTVQTGDDDEEPKNKTSRGKDQTLKPTVKSSGRLSVDNQNKERESSPVTPDKRLSSWMQQPEAIHDLHDVSVLTRRKRKGGLNAMKVEGDYYDEQMEQPHGQERTSPNRAQPSQTYGYPTAPSDPYYPSEQAHYTPRPVEYQATGYPGAGAYGVTPQQTGYTSYNPDGGYAARASYDSSRTAASYQSYQLAPQRTGWELRDNYSYQSPPSRSPTPYIPPPPPLQHQHTSAYAPQVDPYAPPVQATYASQPSVYDAYTQSIPPPPQLPAQTGHYPAQSYAPPLPPRSPLPWDYSQQPPPQQAAHQTPMHTQHYDQYAQQVPPQPSPDRYSSYSVSPSPSQQYLQSPAHSAHGSSQVSLERAVTSRRQWTGSAHQQQLSYDAEIARAYSPVPPPLPPRAPSRQEGYGYTPSSRPASRVQQAAYEYETRYASSPPPARPYSRAAVSNRSSQASEQYGYSHHYQQQQSQAKPLPPDPRSHSRVSSAASSSYHLEQQQAYEYHQRSVTPNPEYESSYDRRSYTQESRAQEAPREYAQESTYQQDNYPTPPKESRRQHGGVSRAVTRKKISPIVTESYYEEQPNAYQQPQETYSQSQGRYEESRVSNTKTERNSESRQSHYSQYSETSSYAEERSSPADYTSSTSSFTHYEEQPRTHRTPTQSAKTRPRRRPAPSAAEEVLENSNMLRSSTPSQSSISTSASAASGVSAPTRRKTMLLGPRKAPARSGTPAY